MSKQRIEALIKHFTLIQHPEGGYYSEQYRSKTNLVSPVNSLPRASLSHIYFLLTKDQFSRWHKVLHDEIWNVYEGSPLRILSFNGKNIVDEVIGANNPGDSPRDFFKVIKGGDYQAAQSAGEYTFVGCSVAPGFEFSDFSYMEDVETKEYIESSARDYAKFL